MDSPQWEEWVQDPPYCPMYYHRAGITPGFRRIPYIFVNTTDPQYDPLAPVPEPGPGLNITTKNFYKDRFARIYGDDLSQAEKTYVVEMQASDDHRVKWPAWSFNIHVKDPCMDSTIEFTSDNFENKSQPFDYEVYDYKRVIETIDSD